MEIWKPVIGYEEAYEVSDLGRVRRIETGLVLSPAGQRYLYVCMTVKCKRHTKSVHKLVTRAFLGPTPDGHQVNHKDGNKKNNVLNNLEYVTRSYNIVHAHKVLKIRKAKGIHNGNGRFTDQQVWEIRNSSKTASELASQYGAHVATISSFKSGRYRGYVSF